MTEPNSASEQAATALVESDSTAPVATSCVSLPANGFYPHGNLQVHRQGDTGDGQQSSRDGMPALSPEEGSLGTNDGDIFLLLDLLEGFTVGCDAAALTIKSARPVLGFRGLPPGAHLVWVSDPQQISRCGYWCVTSEDSPGRVRVKQWDRYNEFLGDPDSQFEAKSHSDNIASIAQNLLPYNLRQQDNRRQPPPQPKNLLKRTSESDPNLALDEGAIWHRLTSSITEDLLRRVTGNHLPDTHEWLVDTTDTTEGEVNFAQASKLFKAVVGSELTFLFPRDDSGLNLDQLVQPSSSASSNGTASPDTTDLIRSVIDHREGISETDVVGELQFAYLTAIHLGNPSCLEYWLHFVIRVLLRAHRLHLDRPALARSLVTTLHAQLGYNDRFVDSSSASGTAAAEDTSSGILNGLSEGRKSRLREALVVYNRKLNESLLGLGDAVTNDQVAVGRAFSDLEAWFWSHGWDLKGNCTQPLERSVGLIDDRPQQPLHRRGLEVDGDDSDDDECRPVIVELDEDGREVGLVSWNS